MNPITDIPVSPSCAFSTGSAAWLGANDCVSTALGITVTFAAGIPRATMSLRRPSQIVVTRSSVIDGCVLPERAHLVHDGDAELAADAKRGDRVQHRRMRVQDVRTH